MKRLSPRVIVLALLLAVLGGTTAVASAKTHMVCVINEDNAPDSTQHGLCVIVNDPTVPTLP